MVCSDLQRCKVGSNKHPERHAHWAAFLGTMQQGNVSVEDFGATIPYLENRERQGIVSRADWETHHNNNDYTFPPRV